jgi:hypothetical protein
MRDVEIIISQLTIEFYDILRSVSKPDFIKRGHHKGPLTYSLTLTRPRDRSLEEQNLAIVDNLT